MSSHSGDEVVSSPTNSAIWQPSAIATWRSTWTDALPTPSSRFARWRSDTAEASESARRVMPLRARSARTRSPSATRKGSRSVSPLRASGAARSEGSFMFMSLEIPDLEDAL